MSDYLKITVEIPRSEEENLKRFLEQCGGKTCEDVGETGKNEGEEEVVSPVSIAHDLRKWLRDNTVSVAVFAKEVIKRSQGTLSSLLNGPPEALPSGAGREPWEKMKKFLTSPEEQQKLLDKKIIKGQKKPNDDAGTSHPQASKKRKVFQKVENASMDAVFKASNGLPSANMTERLAESMDLTKSQVTIWFQNHRRLAKEGKYVPGQYSQPESQ